MAIPGFRPVHGMNLRIYLLAMLLAVAAPNVVVSAQSQPAFEVASIRRNVHGGDARVDITRGRVTMNNATLRTLIRNGYDIQNFQFAGGPGWLDSDAYDISATIADHAEVSEDQYRALVRTLLAERFGLKVHWETRQATFMRWLWERAVRS